jgi:hypothetical protein
MARKNLAPAQGASNDVARSEDAATRKALVHKGLVLHFMGSSQNSENKAR